MQLYDAITFRSSTRDSAQLRRDPWYDVCDGVSGGMSMTLEALEAVYI